MDLHHFIQKEVAGSEKLHLPKYELLLGEKMWTKGYILDVGSSERFQSVMTNCSPCLTKTRLSQDGYYIPKLRRRLLTLEAASLQGLPAQILNAMQGAAAIHRMPARTVEGSIGDTMSINVLATVVMHGLSVAGLANFKAKSPWTLVRCGEVEKVRKSSTGKSEGNWCSPSFPPRSWPGLEPSKVGVERCRRDWGMIAIVCLTHILLSLPGSGLGWDRVSQIGFSQ